MSISKQCFQKSYAALSQIFPSIKKDLETKDVKEQQADLQLRYVLLDGELDDESLENGTRLMCLKCEKLYPGDNWTAKLISYSKPMISEEWTDVVRAIRNNIQGESSRYNPDRYKKQLRRMYEQCPLAFIVANKLGFQYCADNIQNEICISQIRMACEAEKNRAEIIGGYIDRYEDIGSEIRVGELQKLNVKPALRLLETIKNENT